MSSEENKPLNQSTDEGTTENQGENAEAPNEVASAEAEQQQTETDPPSQNDKSRDDFLSATFGIYLVLALFIIAHLIGNGRLPKPDKYKPSPHMPFDLDNAMRHITHLAKRKRFIGTRGLEDSMQYLKAELDDLRPIARKNGFELDVELTRSGPSSYRLKESKSSKNMNSYDNLPNIVARLRPASIPYDTALRPLLINAHVDSALASPGVSDILAGVGIIMELVRAVASRPADDVSLKRPVIFLLNGAEEVGLAAAHAFVTQHPWGRVSAAFINIESMGSGRAFHLFRVGPNSAWLGRAFAKAVSFPSGTVAATDVFNMNLVPAETDYTVFTQYGDIPGYDFAILDNGNIYHTRYDDLDRLDIQGVLHGGITSYELMMELVGKNDAIGEHLAGRDESSRLSTAASRVAAKVGLLKNPENSRLAYFDILYFVTVFYEEGMATMVHSLIITFSILACVTKLGGMTRRDILSCVRMAVTLPITIVGGFASATFASAVYARVLGAPMVWFGSRFKAIIIFVPPALFGMCGVLLLLLPRRLRAGRYDHMLLSCIFIQILLASAGVRHSLMMAYIPCASLMVMVPCLMMGETMMPIAKHLAIMLIHSALLEKLYYLCLSVFLPIISRSKVENVPHDTVAALVVIFLSMPYMIVPSVPLLTQYPMGLRRLRGILFAFCLWTASYFLLIAPILNGEPGRTPYSKSAPKRVIVTHMHSPQLPVDAVMHISGLGPNPVDVRRIMAPLMGTDNNLGSLPSKPTYGTLQSDPMEPVKYETRYTQTSYSFRTGNKPDLEIPVFQQLEQVRTNDGWNVTYSIEAKDSHVITVRLPVGERSPVTNWSFQPSVGEFKEEVWFRHFGSSRIEFWVVMNGNNNTGRPTVKAAVISMRLGVSRSQNDLAKLNFTSWESAVMFVSTGIEVDL